MLAQENAQQLAYLTQSETFTQISQLGKYAKVHYWEPDPDSPDLLFIYNLFKSLGEESPVTEATTALDFKIIQNSKFLLPNIPFLYEYFFSPPFYCYS